MENCLFDFPTYSVNKKIRLIELFGGIGSQAMALRDIGADFEHYKLVEFDKYAVASYNAIHNTQHTTHDIRQIHAKDLEITDKDKYCYLMTYSFPCTDLSVAGKMQGMSKEEWEKGNSTRSGLLWEVERILKECTKEELPDVLLMENVPQVHAEQNEKDFNAWLNFLKSKGYKNFWKDLNAKDYGIPQNRDRCFCVSFLSDDDFMEYEFPEPVKLTTVMKDYLEEEVDEKYYINTDKANKLIKQLITNGVIGGLKDRKTIDLTIKNPQTTDVANCIVSHVYKDGKNIYKRAKEGNGVIEIAKTRILGNIEGKYEIINRVYDKEVLCPTLNTCQGGGHEPKIIDKCIVAMRGRNPDKPTSRKAGLPTEQRLEKAPEGMVNTLTTVQKDNMVMEKEKIIKVGGCFDASYPDSKTRRGRVQEGGDITPTITAQGGENINYVETVYRIRKLTPKECWRLMGYTDEDYDNASQVNSGTQLYKQAGNAIVKQVLMAIFSQLNIKGVKAWNDMTETEKRDIIKKTTMAGE